MIAIIIYHPQKENRISEGTARKKLPASSLLNNI
jgi:hypothetical protein